MIIMSLIKPSPDETIPEDYSVPNRATTAATNNALPIVLRVSCSGSGLLSPNAAPEWQARILRWRSREIMVACPLEGLVRLPDAGLGESTR
jgi:hypothetical protein